jgi:MoxR-like ATPase
MTGPEVNDGHDGARAAAHGRQPDWRIYRGGGEPHDGIALLPEPPQWRRFAGTVLDPPPDWSGGDVGATPGTVERARSYRPSEDLVDAVNAALYLRRPLLVTGKPGTGKSTLAYSIAYELGLGPVLHWPITSRSILDDALYRYDPIGRLQEANLRRTTGEPFDQDDFGRYLRLGPLGTAMLPARRPRVLLVDELDKSDIDLPNDLLTVFEEGRYEIPPLTRLPDELSRVPVLTADAGRLAAVERGQVTCLAFPVVVITSNAEREFPPAFLRRCVQVNIQIPDSGRLAEIIAAQLGPEAAAESVNLIQQFVARRDAADLATDQLLNAIYLTMWDNQSADDRDRLVRIALRAIGAAVPQR